MDPGYDCAFGDAEASQYLLIWAGGYAGLVDGVLGAQSRSSFTRWITGRYQTVPTNFDESHDRALREDASARADTVGFEIIRDNRLDVTFGLPSALLGPVANPDPLRRTYRATDGSIELEVAWLRGRYASLVQLYDRLAGLPGRRVEYSRFAGTWFVQSGTLGERSFYLRYEDSGEEIRGFSISYHPSWVEVLRAPIVAMSNIFRTTAAANDPLIQFAESLHAGEDTEEDAPPIAIPKADHEKLKKVAIGNPSTVGSSGGDDGPRIFQGSGLRISVSSRGTRDGQLAMISLEGRFELGDDYLFKQVLLTVHGSKTLVSLRSDGGLLQPGIEIGRTIWTNQFGTVVEDGVCASVCALAWLAGRPRYVAPNAAIGFHAPWLGNESVQQVSSVGSALVGGYLTELGMKAEAIAYMTEMGPNEMRWLTPSDARLLGVYTEDWTP